MSYAHDDEASLGFIDAFKSVLEHFTYANSGRKLDIFIDHDSIGWGDDWRESIRDSIDTALVFMPLITLRYLDRPMCREELQLFVDSAEKLGVTDLFLPVVVLGHAQITESNTDPVVQLIAGRQFKDLKSAVIEGTGSAAWRAAMLDLSEALVAAVEKAEDRLQRAAQAEVALRSPGGVADPAMISADDGRAGLIELTELVNADSASLVSLTEEFVSLLGEFQELVTPMGSRLEGVDQNQGRMILTQMAAELSGPAQRMGEVGTEMEAVTVRVDGAIRAALRLISEIDDEGMRQSLRKSVVGSIDSDLSELGAVVDMITMLLGHMQGVEVLSVPMRTALQPLRKGVTSVRSAVQIVQSWPNLSV